MGNLVRGGSVYVTWSAWSFRGILCFFLGMRDSFYELACMLALFGLALSILGGGILNLIF